MGIPYSKEINIAFAQVTPLVAAGFEVLQTTKNISILLAAVQILTTVFLLLILLALLALICVVNPDLVRERDELVTPVVRWLAGWVLVYGHGVSWALRVGLVAAVSKKPGISPLSHQCAAYGWRREGLCHIFRVSTPLAPGWGRGGLLVIPS